MSKSPSQLLMFCTATAYAQWTRKGVSKISFFNSRSLKVRVYWLLYPLLYLYLKTKMYLFIPCNSLTSKKVRIWLDFREVIEHHFLTEFKTLDCLKLYIYAVELRPANQRRRRVFSYPPVSPLFPLCGVALCAVPWCLPMLMSWKMSPSSLQFATTFATAAAGLSVHHATTAIGEAK